MTAPLNVTGVLANVPARKRNVPSMPSVFENPQSRLNKVKPKPETRNTFRRPLSSEIGAMQSGPMAKPRRKQELVRVTCQLVRWMSAAISVIAAEGDELAKVDARVVEARTARMEHLRSIDQFCGFNLSVSVNVTSLPVFSVPRTLPEMFLSNLLSCSSSILVIALSSFVVLSSSRS